MEYQVGDHVLVKSKKDEQFVITAMRGGVHILKRLQKGDDEILEVKKNEIQERLKETPLPLECRVQCLTQDMRPGIVSFFFFLAYIIN